MATRNSDVLADFILYCETHPSERFWQALRNWAGVSNWLIFTNKMDVAMSGQDTFYWEGKNE